MGVTDDGIGHVAKEGPPQPAESAAAYHYEVGVYLLGQVYDGFVSPFVHLEVGDSDGAARLFDLLYLLVQYLLRLAPEILLPRLGVDLVDRRGKRAPDRDDVEPRPGAVR